MNNDYIECRHTKSLSRKHHQVSMACRRRKKCAAFAEWLDLQLCTTMAVGPGHQIPVNEEILS